MGKYEKLLKTIIVGQSDANISFNDLCHLLESLGFQCRTRGSHHCFVKEGIEEIINLQRDQSGKAKRYQIRQVRNILIKHRLGGNI